MVIVRRRNIEAEVPVPNGLWGESQWKHCGFLRQTLFLVVVCGIIVYVS